MITTLIIGMMTSVSTPQDRWPDELTIPTIEEFSQGMKHSGGDTLYNHGSTVINLSQGATYDESVRQSIMTLIDPSSLPRYLRPNSSRTHLNAIVQLNDVSSFTVSYGDTFAGSFGVSIIRCLTAADAEERLTRAPVGLTVIAPRVRKPGVDIGDDHLFVYHGQGAGLMFQVGRHLVTVHNSTSGTEQAEADCLAIGRAIEFRLYKNGLVGDHDKDFELTDGRKVRGVRSPQKYVPLKNLERLGIEVTHHLDESPRYSILKRGDKTVRVSEFEKTLVDNGQAKTCPPAIPYDGDLWVPLTATLRALGLQER